MEIINLIQGTDAWHSHRADHHNGSDAPAMFGVSKYESRDSLLQRTKSGRAREFSKFVQERVIDQGHAAESAARSLAEKIAGKNLFPVTGKNEKYSASFDGLTMNEKTSWEHKSLNDELRAFFAAGGEGKDLPIMYRVQMEHQFIVSDSEKCLFMASKWDDEGNLIEEHHVWYYPDLELRKDIVARWEQFERDLENYVPVLIPENVIVEDIKPLPTISVAISAQVLDTNVDEVFNAHQKFIAEIKPANTLETDEDFAYGEKLVKFSTEFEDYCQSAEDNALSQAASVNDFIMAVRTMREGTRSVRLAYKKALDAKKESVKNNAILKAKNDYIDFVSALSEGCLVNFRNHLQAPDFAGAIKNVRTMSGMHQRINDALAGGKAAADTLAKDVKAKIAHIQAAIVGYEHLFIVSDLALKEMDFIDLHIQSKKQQEDQRKAEHEAAIKARAEAISKLEAEQGTKAAQPVNGAKAEDAQPVTPPPASASSPALHPQTELADFEDILAGTSEAPGRESVIGLVSEYYGVTEHQAEQWLNEMFAVAKAA